ncbi:MAG: 5-formyltetrahydrofolate cyclo-ligase [Phycisphaerales bacterium JB043]
MSNEDAKRALRTLMRNLIEAVPAEDLADASCVISESLVSEVRALEARAVMMWMPLAQEVSLLHLGETLVEEGIRVCVPRMRWEERSMEPVAVTSFTEGYEIRRHGIREPVDTLALPLEALDVVFVPGLAFDARGNRLGRAGGFYDRFLSRLDRNVTSVIGVCLNAQRVEHVPTEEHDLPVDGVCCERRISRGVD